MKKESKSVLGQIGVGLALGFSLTVPGLNIRDLASSAKRFGEMSGSLSGKKGFWRFALTAVILFVTFVLGLFLLCLPMTYADTYLSFGVMLLCMALAVFTLPFTFWMIWKKGFKQSKEYKDFGIIIAGILGLVLGGALGYFGDGALLGVMFGDSPVYVTYLIALIPALLSALTFFVPGFSGSFAFMSLGIFPSLVNMGSSILRKQTPLEYLPVLLFMDFAFVMFMTVLALGKKTIEKKSKIDIYLAAFGALFTIAEVACYAYLHGAKLFEPFYSLTNENDIQREIWSFVGLGAAGAAIGIAVCVSNFYRIGLFKADDLTIRGGEAAWPGEKAKPKYDARNDWNNRFKASEAVPTPLSPAESSTEFSDSAAAVADLSNLLAGQSLDSDKGGSGVDSDTEKQKEESKPSESEKEEQNKKAGEDDLDSLAKLLKGEK